MSDAIGYVIAAVIGWMLAVMTSVMWAQDKVIIEGGRLFVTQVHDQLGCSDDEFVNSKNECVHVDVIAEQTGD